MNLTVVNASRKLVDIWKIGDTLDEVIDEPWGVLGTISYILLLLLVASDILFFAST